MNSPLMPFGAQLIGQTEKTMNAILDRVLAGRVSEPEWVALVLLAGGVGSAEHGEFTVRVAHALKESQDAAAARIAQLATKGLVQIAPERPAGAARPSAIEGPQQPGPGSRVVLTESGQQLMGSVRTQVDDVTQRLWGDLPAADLEVAGKVLRTVLDRAEAEIGAGS